MPNTLSSAERRSILAAEMRKARHDVAMRNDGTIAERGRLSGAQVAAAKGIARKRALAIIDVRCAA